MRAFLIIGIRAVIIVNQVVGQVENRVVYKTAVNKLAVFLDSVARHFKLVDTL